MDENTTALSALWSLLMSWLGTGKATLLVAGMIAYAVSQVLAIWVWYSYGQVKAPWYGFLLGFSWYRFLADPAYIKTDGSTPRKVALVLAGLGIALILVVLVWAAVQIPIHG